MDWLQRNTFWLRDGRMDGWMDMNKKQTKHNLIGAQESVWQVICTLRRRRIVAAPFDNSIIGAETAHTQTHEMFAVKYIIVQYLSVVFYFYLFFFSWNDEIGEAEKQTQIGRHAMQGASIQGILFPFCAWKQIEMISVAPSLPLALAETGCVQCACACDINSILHCNKECVDNERAQGEKFNHSIGLFATLLLSYITIDWKRIFIAAKCN